MHITILFNKIQKCLVLWHFLAKSNSKLFDNKLYFLEDFFIITKLYFIIISNENTCVELVTDPKNDNETMEIKPKDSCFSVTKERNALVFRKFP